MNNDVLVYDIETYVPTGKPDVDKDELRIFACYSYKTRKSYVFKDLESIQKIINAHKFLVGYNTVGSFIGKNFIKGYDNPVLERLGISFKYKICIDLRKIFKQRAAQMKIKKGMLGDLIMEYSLDYITKLLGIVDDDSGKKKIDKGLFFKELWTDEETKLMCDYARRDIDVTKKLYEWVEDYFSVFKDFLKEEDVNKKSYLTSSIAGFAYKAICKEMGWEETKGTYPSDDEVEKIKGGYVAYPAGEFFEGDIYCIDFNSLYPMIMIQCNLYGRKHEQTMEEVKVWNGGDKWEVEGEYFSEEMNDVGKLLKRWYEQRLEYKSNKDRREYTIKIILNASYGILDSPYYAEVYDRIAAGDCTRLGRQWTMFARKILRDVGYKLIATDTDSVFIVDPFKDKKKMMGVIKEIIDGIKLTLPFSYEHFDMGIDDEIKYMYFFKGKDKDDKDDEIMDEDDVVNKPLGLMKKNYVYVTKDDKVVIKNLGIKKKSCSALSREIFWKHLVPEIKMGKIKFSKTFLRNLVYKKLGEDIDLIVMRKEVGVFDSYTSKTCSTAQISKRYGAGIHFLIPNNKKVGAGTTKKFCTLEEFKENKMGIDDIDLDNVWKELEYFVKPVVVKNVFEY